MSTEPSGFRATAREDLRVETMGGYRLIRRLGAGARAEVFLGRAETEPASAVAALKIFRSSVPANETDGEIAALTRTRSRHLLRLIDVTTAHDGRPVLVLPRLGGGSLGRLLAEREAIGAGEAVTILAPVCDAVVELHAARCYHGAIRPGAVLFDDTGAPVLSCFGSATIFGGDQERSSATPAELAAEPGVAADLERLGALAGVVLTRVAAGAPAPSSTKEMLGWLREADPAQQSQTFAAELRERLYALAPATPIGLFHGAAPAPRAIAARIEPDVAAVQETPTPDSTVPSPAERGVYRRLIALLRKIAQELPSISRLRLALGSTRKSFLLIGAAGVAAVVVAAVMLPSTGGADAGGRPSSTPRAARGTSAPHTTSAAKPSHSQAVAAVGDDPVAALQQLLQVRDTCIARLSVSCLDAVDQPGSAALDDDSYLIRSLRQGAATASAEPLHGATAALSERLGDSALLTLEVSSSGGLSVLIVKQSAGWRIRDFLPR